MNYFKCIIILILSFAALSYTSERQNKLRTGFYYLAEKETEGVLIEDIDSENKFAVDERAVLSSSDFSAARFVTRNFQPDPLKVIELKLTKEGRKKWIEIQNRIIKTGESIIFICNDRVYLEKTISGKGTLATTKIDLFIESKYQQEILDILKFEINDHH